MLKIIALILAMAVFYFVYYEWRKAIDNYKYIFLSAKLHGKVTSITASSSGERLRVDNSDTIYIFRSGVSYLNNNTFFYAAAEIGDSVYKSSFSDTLILIKKNGKKFDYVFENGN